ncbi:MAG: hypothetical protein ABSF91_00900 [Bacteroidota bacterium]|jgi:hypothetical protein
MSTPSAKPARVYLSGGMEYADGEGAQWRNDLQPWLENTLGQSVFNPNVESNRFFSRKYPSIDFRKLKTQDLPLYREIARQLVDLDCKEIAERSNYVICYWDEGAAKGAGTKGELTMAKFFGKPVYLVTSFPLDELPGWVLGCVTKTFPDFDELKSFLSSR